MGNAEIDALILETCGTRWRKVAFVVAATSEKAGLQDKAWGLNAIAKRLRVLVRKRKLEAVGNIWNWRASEVRLPPAQLAPNPNARDD